MLHTGLEDRREWRSRYSKDPAEKGEVGTVHSLLPGMLQETEDVYSLYAYLQLCLFTFLIWYSGMTIAK